MKRLTNLIVFAIAVVYFLLDALFATVAVPLARWIAGHWAFDSVKRWIRSLSPYPTLALFVVPVILLEPAKPAAAWLVATDHMALGLSVLAIAEILKLVCVERLFSISRAKLLSIPAFAWCYGKYSAVRNYLTSLEAWQLVLRWSRLARNAAQRVVLDVRRSTARGNGRWLPTRERA